MHELSVLIQGFTRDNRCHTHRSMNPDEWEWDTAMFFRSMTLRELMIRNWNGEGDGPKLFTPKYLKGLAETGVAVSAEGQSAKAGVPDQITDVNGVKTTKVVPKGVQVASAADLAAFRAQSEAKRRKAAEARTQTET